MPRRAAAVRREVQPDAKYNNRLVTQLINKVLLDGKKSLAEDIVYGAFDMIEDPLQFGAGEIGIDDETGLFPGQIRESLPLQFIRVIRRTAALPYDRVIDGFPRFFVPYDRRFPLIRDPDCRDVPVRRTGFGQSLHGNAEHR